jgi:hypothetical protein
LHPSFAFPNYAGNVPVPVPRQRRRQHTQLFMGVRAAAQPHCDDPAALFLGVFSVALTGSVWRHTTQQNDSHNGVTK